MDLEYSLSLLSIINEDQESNKDLTFSDIQLAAFEKKMKEQCEEQLNLRLALEAVEMNTKLIKDEYERTHVEVNGMKEHIRTAIDEISNIKKELSKLTETEKMLETSKLFLEEHTRVLEKKLNQEYQKTDQFKQQLGDSIDKYRNIYSQRYADNECFQKRKVLAEEALHLSCAENEYKEIFKHLKQLEDQSKENFSQVMVKIVVEIAKIYMNLNKIKEKKDETCQNDEVVHSEATQSTTQMTNLASNLDTLQLQTQTNFVSQPGALSQAYSMMDTTSQITVGDQTQQSVVELVSEVFAPSKPPAERFWSTDNEFNSDVIAKHFQPWDNQQSNLLADIDPSSVTDFQPSFNFEFSTATPEKVSFDGNFSFRF